MRMNLGCPRVVLEQALKQLEYAVNKLELNRNLEIQYV